MILKDAIKASNILNGTAKKELGESMPLFPVTTHIRTSPKRLHLLVKKEIQAPNFRNKLSNMILIVTLTHKIGDTYPNSRWQNG